MRIAVGSEHVGAVSGARFADFSHHVAHADGGPGKLAGPPRAEMPVDGPEAVA